MHRYYWVGVGTIALVLAASHAHAALMHAPVMGNTVTFSGIEEDSNKPLPPGGLYRQPGTIGDTLDFGPSAQFKAESSSGGPPATDVTDGRLDVMVTAKPGSVIDVLSFFEGGLATLFLPPGSPGDPFAGVTGTVLMDIVGVDGLPVTPIELGPFPLTYAPSDGTYQHTIDNDVAGVDTSLGSPIFSSGWTGSLSVNLTDILIANNVDFWEGVTKVNVSLNNQLIASTIETGSTAFIDKKDFKIRADTIPDDKIPEPSSLLLVTFAMVLVAGAWRRS